MAGDQHNVAGLPSELCHFDRVYRQKLRRPAALRRQRRAIRGCAVLSLRCRREGALSGEVARAGRRLIGGPHSAWSVIGDIMLSQVSPSGTLPGPLASGVEVRSRSLTLQGDVLYRLYDTDTFDVDAGVGLRFWRLGNRLSIEPGALPITLSTTETRNWVDPVLAGRIIAQLGGPWSVTAVGDIGGFGVGSRLTWQAIGTVNYQWNEQLALRLGYRVLSVDYEEGAFLYDVRMQGPILGGTYRF